MHVSCSLDARLAVRRVVLHQFPLTLQPLLHIAIPLHLVSYVLQKLSYRSSLVTIARSHCSIANHHPVCTFPALQNQCLGCCKYHRGTTPTAPAPPLQDHSVACIAKPPPRPHLPYLAKSQCSGCCEHHYTALTAAAPPLQDHTECRMYCKIITLSTGTPVLSCKITGTAYCKTPPY